MSKLEKGKVYGRDYFPSLHIMMMLHKNLQIKIATKIFFSYFFQTFAFSLRNVTFKSLSWIHILNEWSLNVNFNGVGKQE